MALLCVFSALCLLCLCARLFLCALWSPAGLWCLTVSVSLSIGILSQVWYLIVSIPDLCNLTYLDLGCIGLDLLIILVYQDIIQMSINPIDAIH